MMMFLSFMPSLLTMLKKYRHIVFPALMALIVVAFVVGVYLKGHANGYSRAIEETNREKLETINENLRIKQKSDNIVRPSELVLIERLRGKSF